MNKVTPAISCSSVELAYLAGLVSDAPLLGVPDPFHGFVALEVEAALAQARADLIGRQLIRTAEDGAVAPAPDLEPLLRACTESAVSYRLARTLAGAGTSCHHFHWTPVCSVELSFAPEDASVTIMAVSGLPERIAELLRLGDQAAPPYAAGQVSEPLLQRVRELTEEHRAEEAGVLLHQAGINLDMACQFAADLASPVMNGALVAIAQSDGRWTTRSIALVEGAQGLWLLKPGQTQAAIIPSGAAGARAEILQLIGR